MDEHTEELEQLKQLMQDLFVIDLKNKADELRNGIITDYEKAVKRYKDQFYEAYEEKYNEINKKGIDEINLKLDKVLEDNKKINDSFPDIISKSDSLSDTITLKFNDLKEKQEKELIKINEVESNTDTLQLKITKLVSVSDENKIKFSTKLDEIEKLADQQDKLAKKMEKEIQLIKYFSISILAALLVICILLIVK